METESLTERRFGTEPRYPTGRLPCYRHTPSEVKGQLYAPTLTSGRTEMRRSYWDLRVWYPQPVGWYHCPTIANGPISLHMTESTSGQDSIEGT